MSILHDAFQKLVRESLDNSQGGSESKEETVHYYLRAGIPCIGYGPSMDPHHCGDEDEPCATASRTVFTSKSKYTITKVNGEDR